MNKLFEVLTRKKVLDASSLTETQLARVLNTFDLTALGVGSTLGVGVYILAGQVAREVAGPAVVLSFLIAALASVFAGVCYAEFGSRVPRAGSAYIYSYVCIGEFVAFIIGWNLILEYVIGSASVAKGLSLYLDTLINDTLQNTFREIAPINVSFLGSYFDFFSFGISVILAVALGCGLKNSATVNTVFTMLNLFVVVFIVIAGSFKADPENWDLPAPPDSHYGKGGFFPYGVSGIIKGAATCFYGFVGFDCIATTGEEVRNPQKAIPFAIIASLAIIFLAYFGTASIVTLMVPYYLQDVNAPIPHAFEMVGWDIAKWIVAIGGIFGLCASLFGAMFPLPRIIYAMANDGIIFKFLGKVNSRFHTPLIGTLLAGILTGLMSALFDLKHLVDMMSIGTLLAYSIVAACVLVLRYSPDEDEHYNLVPTVSDSETDGNINNDSLLHTTSTDLLASNEKVSFCSLLKQTFNLRMLQLPTKVSHTVVTIQIYIFVILSVCLWLCTIYLENHIKNAEAWAIILISIIGLLMILSIMSIATQPNSQAILNFKVPLVPLIPAISILINIYLMLMLDVHTWIRFAVWMAVGLPMYFISIRYDTPLSIYTVHAKSNGTAQKTQKSNGQANINYVIDETDGKNNKDILEQNEDLAMVVANNLNKSGNVKLKPKAPLPPIVPNNIDTPICSSLDSLSVSGALAALDEVLTKEELAISQSFSYDNPFSRKISVDTVSNVSNIHFEESVIALIHNEDIHHEFEHPLPILEEHTDIESDSSSNNEKEDILKGNNSPIPTPKLSFQDINSNLSESAISNNMQLPPPPPPMDGFLTFKKKLVTPRPSFSRSKSVPVVVFQSSNSQTGLNSSSSSSRKTSTDSGQEDNDVIVSIGSPQYKKVALKLNKFLERHSMGPPVLKLTKPETIDNQEDFHNSLPNVTSLKLVLAEMPKQEQSDVENDDGVVEEEVMKPADIKKKLNELLKFDPRSIVKARKSSVIDNAVKSEEFEKVENNIPKSVGVDEASHKMMHKNLMGNTLKSIKLLKKDSFISNSIESDT
ncbi:hypothetical protein RI129_006290 [Pyrocoelia pectoralis]|uniref:Cationic amino acid transporter C-terminal domain-containing protein n=1 Tax=Pyrocoelia pectoralis TaxID=417401 RepID=A0AAN7ZG28_9COLE